MYKVEKSYVDKLVALNPLLLSLLSTSREFFIDQNIFFPDLSYEVSQYLMTLALIAVRQEINNLEMFSSCARARICNESRFKCFFYAAWVANTS